MFERENSDREIIDLEICFQNVSRPHDNEKPAFVEKSSSCLKSGLENLRQFSDGLV